MTVSRFCSLREYNAFLAGKRLVNHTDHGKNHNNSTSKGFCFTKESPDKAVKYLSGIVDVDVCMTLEFPDGYLTKSYGKYRDVARSTEDTIIPCAKEEWWCLEYDNKTARLINVDFSYIDTYPNARDLRIMLNLQ